MKFDEALKLMKQGVPIKLPSWGGYWAWDSDRETIVMHTKEGKEMDIRSTDRVEYTLQNVASDEWIPADEGNCTLMGGTPTFGFDTAIKYLKRGMKVARAGWNGKNQYVELATCISYKNAANEIVNVDHDAIGNCALAFVGTSGVQLGWLASQSDMLGQDWRIVD